MVEVRWESDVGEGGGWLCLYSAGRPRAGVVPVHPIENSAGCVRAWVADCHDHLSRLRSAGQRAGGVGGCGRVAVTELRGVDEKKKNITSRLTLAIPDLLGLVDPLRLGLLLLLLVPDRSALHPPTVSSRELSLAAVLACSTAMAQKAVRPARLQTCR